MPAFDDILFLEQSISEIQRELDKAPDSKAAVYKEIDSAEEQVALHLKDWNICIGNIRHMREVADHVVLAEYIEIVKTRDEEREFLDRARVRLAKAKNALDKMVAHIESLLAALADRQAAKAEFGQLRHFPKKD